MTNWARHSHSQALNFPQMVALVSVFISPLSLDDNHGTQHADTCVYVVALGRHNKFVAQAYAHPQNEIGHGRKQ